jgi:hypothetical protein
VDNTVMTKSAEKELLVMRDQCRCAGWDGFDASPVSDETISKASRFLGALPHDTPKPTIGAEPDGDVTFEWYKTPQRLLSVSISRGGKLHYAALIGPDKKRGTEDSPGEVSQMILSLIRRVYG